MKEVAKAEREVSGAARAAGGRNVGSKCMMRMGRRRSRRSLSSRKHQSVEQNTERLERRSNAESGVCAPTCHRVRPSSASQRPAISPVHDRRPEETTSRRVV